MWLLYCMAGYIICAQCSMIHTEEKHYNDISYELEKVHRRLEKPLYIHQDPKPEKPKYVINATVAMDTV